MSRCTSGQRTRALVCARCGRNDKLQVLGWVWWVSGVALDEEGPCDPTNPGYSWCARCDTDESAEWRAAPLGSACTDGAPSCER